jgi:hypothetical protein
MGNRGGVNRVLVGKLWGKRPLQIVRCRWEDNIKMYPKEIQWESINWINLAWSTEHDNEPSGSTKYRVFSD